MVSLEEAQRRLVEKKNPRPAVSITFDDGYDANCDEAIPLLIARKIPCTYFVSSRCVLEGIPFPHDVGEACTVRPNTLEQIRAMAAAGVEIGAHTRTHADIGRLHNPRELHDEVVGSGRDLQQALGRPVRYFAFPFGQPKNMNAAGIPTGARIWLRGRLLGIRRLQLSRRRSVPHSAHLSRQHAAVEELADGRSAQDSPPLSLRLPKSRCVGAGAGSGDGRR